MFALLKIGRIYKTPKLFTHLQGPICYRDPQNKGINLIVCLKYNHVKFAYHFHTNYCDRAARVGEVANDNQ